MKKTTSKFNYLLVFTISIFAALIPSLTTIDYAIATTTMTAFALIPLALFSIPLKKTNSFVSLTLFIVNASSLLRIGVNVALAKHTIPYLQYKCVRFYLCKFS